MKALKHINVPCPVALTLRKIKVVPPSLKAEREKALRSRVIYKITCSHCLACYFGQTDRHVSVRFREHMPPSQPIAKHLRECDVKISFDNKDAVKIIRSTAKSIPFLEALEAL